MLLLQQGINLEAPTEELLLELRARFAPSGDLWSLCEAHRLHHISWEWWVGKLAPAGYPPTNPLTASGRYIPSPSREPIGVAAQFAKLWPNPVNPFEAPATRTPPATPPAGALSVASWYARCWSQTGLWQEVRRQQDTPDSRRAALSWAQLKDAAEPAGRAELRAVAEVLNAFLGAPIPPPTTTGNW